MGNIFDQVITGLGTAAVVAVFAYMMLKNMIDHERELMELIRTHLTSLAAGQATVANVMTQVADKLEELCKK